MTALRHGVHTVTVTPVLESDGPYAEETLGEPVTVRCNVQPVSAAERQDLGLTTTTAYRIKYFHPVHGGKPWPGGPYSKIDWQGRRFEQRGEALLSSMSPRTAHYKIIMVSQASEVR